MTKIYKINIFSPFFRRGKILFKGTADLFLFSFFVLPSYFGIRVIFFDLTILRFLELLLLCFIWKSQGKRKEFLYSVKNVKSNIWIAIYMIIIVYTNLLHGYINPIFYWIFNGVLIFYLLNYLIQYVYGMSEIIRRIKIYTWCICLISPLELFIGKSPFLYLNTLNKSIETTVRFGGIRIAGNCTTSNGYGLYLLILLSICVINIKNKKIDIPQNWLSICLIIINVFLTGARLATALVLLEVGILILFNSKEKIAQIILVISIMIPVLAVFIYAFRNVSFVNNIIGTFLSAVDTLLGTTYSVKYGVDLSILHNSNYYRTLLYRNTIFSNVFNPLYGRGGGYSLHLWVEGYDIQSCDNYYVGQYIAYAWPGVVAWLLMSVSFFKRMLYNAIYKKSNISKALAIGFIIYYIGLWYLDQLQTFPFMIATFAITNCDYYLLDRSTLMKRN